MIILIHSHLSYSKLHVIIEGRFLVPNVYLKIHVLIYTVYGTVTFEIGTFQSQKLIFNFLILDIS